MSQGLAKVKSRIKSVQSTRKITNSMKLVSSVKLRKMNKIAEAQSYYFSSMEKVLCDSIFANDYDFESPFLVSPFNAKKTLHILVTSNMGLCAGYNNNVLKIFKDILKPNDEIIVIGEKGILNLKEFKDVVIYKEFRNHAKDFDYNKAREIADFVVVKYLSNEFKEVKLTYTRYKNSISFIPETVSVLPLNLTKKDSYRYEPIYVGGKEEFINKLIPQFITTQIYSKLYSSFVSEESSRRNAMDNADKNALDLVEKLNLEYNKARQSAITQEITEVVNGSNAVK